MSEIRIILSQDGSHTIHSERFGVDYHSKYGAIQETETVFIGAGLQYQIDRGMTNISILEMGFGTGLNTLMTLLAIKDEAVSVNYHTIEAYPITGDDARKLNYPDLLKLDGTQREAFHLMHDCLSGEITEINPKFQFTKHIVKLEDFESDEKFDIIYFDAFAPSSQEHLWSEEMMAKLASFCKEGAALVTYCAKGSVKRALRSAGFVLEGLPGPIGKREMTRAVYLKPI